MVEGSDTQVSVTRPLPVDSSERRAPFFNQMWYYKTCNIALPPRPEVRGIPRGYDESDIFATW